MEHLWSPAGATGGNRWQMGRPRKPLKQADRQPVATHGNRFAAHGKEGVDGSSPSEGLYGNHEVAAKDGFSVAMTDTADHLLCKEGIDGMAGVENSESCWKSRCWLARASACESWGQVLGTNHGRFEPNRSYAGAMGCNRQEKLDLRHRLDSGESTLVHAEVGDCRALRRWCIAPPAGLRLRDGLPGERRSIVRGH
jgi:hypothetical protein